MASSVTPKAKKLARRLVHYEAASAKHTAAGTPAAFLVCEKLRDPLAKVMGTAGFRSLLARALALASREAPSLRALRVGPDGALAGLDTGGAATDTATRADSDVALTSQLLGLLVTFIGPALTLRLLLDVWPDIDGTDL